MVDIQETEIDVSYLNDWIWDPSCGAEVKFLGKVRNVNRGRGVQSIEYSAYSEMAMNELHKILDEAEEKWSLVKCAVIHRLGMLNVGEVAVAIYVASQHRKEAFFACQYTIDQLKKRVPIWKKEIYKDGSDWVGLQCSDEA